MRKNDTKLYKKSSKNQQKIIILLLIIFLELAVDILLRFHNNGNIQEFSMIFSNIFMPIVTLIALIVYYLTLTQIKQQTDNIEEEKKLLIGENLYKDLILKINEIKEIESKNNLNKVYPDTDRNKSFTVLSIYSHIIIDSVEKLKKDNNYIDLLNRSFTEKIREEQIYTYSFNKYYIALNSTFKKLSDFLDKIKFIIYQIEEEEKLHKSQKSLLLKLLGKELLSDYFLLILNKNHFNYSLIPSNLTFHALGNYNVFAFFNLESVYDHFNKNYNDIINEILILNRN